MLFKSKVDLWIIMVLFLQSTTAEFLSFNQPKFCPNASWNPNGTIFATATSRPYGLFVHVSNTVYATEQDTDRLQIWSDTGGMATKTISAYLNNPAAIFVTMNNDIYVDSGNNRRVEKWTPGATNSIIVMNVTTQCMGLFISIDNSLFCAASDQHQVIKTSLNQDAYSIEVVAGNGTCGTESNELCLPNGIFVDTNFNLYVADWYNDRIQKFKLGELYGETVAGGEKTSETIDLFGPTGVVLDADNYLFIVDMLNNRVIGSGPDGFRCIVGCSQISGSLLNQLHGPRSLAFDSDGNLFVTDRENDRILKFILATNSCSMINSDEDITSTAIQMTSTIEAVTNEKVSIMMTVEQVQNGFDRTSTFVFHTYLWLIILTCNSLL